MRHADKYHCDIVMFMIWKLKNLAQLDRQDSPNTDDPSNFYSYLHLLSGLFDDPDKCLCCLYRMLPEVVETGNNFDWPNFTVSRKRNDKLGLAKVRYFVFFPFALGSWTRPHCSPGPIPSQPNPWLDMRALNGWLGVDRYCDNLVLFVRCLISPQKSGATGFVSP